MSRVLLGGERLRILDENGNPPGATPWRLSFFDASTSYAKAVYYGPLTPTGAAVVALEADGYVPVSGLWLEVGDYTMVVAKRIAYTGTDLLDWQTQWTLPNIPGATAEPSVSGSTIRMFDTVGGMKSATPGGMGYLTGYYSLNDGGQGPVEWVASSTATDDSGSCFLPVGQSPAVAGRWLRVFTTLELDVRAWGAVTGRSDVSSNILLASQYCGRTATDSGYTLVFPSAEYNLGTANLVLNQVGYNLAGQEKKVGYHLHANSVFRATLNTGSPTTSTAASIEFAGTTQVDGLGTHVTPYVGLKFSSQVNNGQGVSPEWWGADATGASYSDRAFYRMCQGLGDNTVNVLGNYIFQMDWDLSCVYSDGLTRPTYNFPNGTGSLDFLALGGQTIDIGTVICAPRSATSRAFNGELGAMHLYSAVNRVSWFDVATVSKFKKLATSLNYVQTVLQWDETYTWDANYNSSTDGGDGVSHEFIGTDTGWFINNTSVVVSAMQPPDRKFLYFASVGSTGYFDISTAPSHKALWYGAHGVGCDIGMQAFLRGTLHFNKEMEFESDASSVTTTLSMYLPESYVVTFRGLTLEKTGDGTPLFELTGASNSVALFDACVLKHTAKANYIITTTTDEFYISNCGLSSGSVSIDSESSVISDSTLNSCNVDNVTGTGKNYVLRCIVTSGTCTSLGNPHTNLLENVLYRDCTFYESSLTSWYFIGVKANGTKVLSKNVRVLNCTFGGIPTNTNPANFWENVKDVTDTGTWFNIDTASAHPYYHGHWHDFLVEGSVCTPNVLNMDTTRTAETASLSGKTGIQTRQPGGLRLTGVETSESRVESAIPLMRWTGDNPNTKGYLNWTYLTCQDWSTSTSTVPANAQYRLAWYCYEAPGSDWDFTVRITTKTLL